MGRHILVGAAHRNRPYLIRNRASCLAKKTSTWLYRKARRVYRRRAQVIVPRIESALCLPRTFIALRFQLRVLVGRENRFRFFHEGSATLLRATAFHAFRLPRFKFCLLVSRDVEARERHAVCFGIGRGFPGTAWCIPCECRHRKCSSPK